MQSTWVQYQILTGYDITSQKNNQLKIKIKTVARTTLSYMGLAHNFNGGVLFFVPNVVP